MALRRFFAFAVERGYEAGFVRVRQAVQGVGKRRDAVGSTRDERAPRNGDGVSFHNSGRGRRGVHTSCVHFLAGMNGNPIGGTNAGFYSTTGSSSEGEVIETEGGLFGKFFYERRGGGLRA